MWKKLSCLILFTVLFGVVDAQAGDFDWIRAVYWDANYRTNWASDADSIAVRDGLKAAGYEVLDAAQLKTWMQARITDKKLSVVVFARDNAPDTVVEKVDATCTLRKYLDAGGKIVFYADIPFWDIGHAGGTFDNPQTAGAGAILGFNCDIAVWDSNTQVKITPTGAKWGLTQGWASVRPISASNVTVLATDAAGNAAAWVRFYVKGDKYRGFVRLWDRGGHPPVADIIRVAEYVGLKASNPRPADGAAGVTMPLLQWDASSFAVWHKVYLGTSPQLTEADLKGRLPAMQAMYFGAPLEPGKTYYWRIDEEEASGTVRTGDVWKFTAAPLTAYSPSPRNGDKWIDPNADLSWQAGQGAFQHALFFGTDQAKVAARDASTAKGQIYLTSFDPGKLALQTTYYWAVDEIGAATYAGDVWSFTTTGGSGGGVKAEYFRNMTVTGAPFLTQIEPDINHTWGNDGPAPGVTDNFSARWTADLEIAVADTYTFIATSDDGTRVWLNDVQIINTWVDRGTTDSVSDPIPLEPGIYSLVMEYYENGGGAVAQLSWQTPSVPRQIIPPGPLQPPVRAKAIYPKDNDVNVPQDLTLMWSTGEKAVTHDVYFGEDEAAVAAATPSTSGIYKGSQAKDNNTFTPGALEWGKTYFWRVDEVNTANAESPWKGSVWSFTTANFLVVDDFESYTDEDTGRIFQTWIDGWGFTTPAPGNPGNGTGATVGYIDPPFAERTIVHGGSQSMPLGYDNAATPNYSETERTFDSPQNWTVNGVNTLSLEVRGYAAVPSVAVSETGGKMSLTGSGADIWGTSDQFTFAFKSLNGDGSIVARVTDIGTGTNRWAKGGVMIRDSLDGGSAYANTVLTGGDGNGAAFQWRLTANAGANWDGAGPAVAVAPPYWVKIERVGDSITGYISADGVAWQQQGTTQTITLTAPAYIGLCVTSHAAGEQRTFKFESIKTTGSVTGAWQGAQIDSPRYNTAQDLYVAIQDSTNKVAVVKDATAVNSATWVEVKMPLSGFTGVNMTKVKKLIIGVGDRTNPVADGTGMLFIDDIRVIKP